MEVAVASGENNFSMSRGSFQYKKNIHNKRKLVRVASVDKGSDADDVRIVDRLSYEDPRSGIRITFRIVEEEHLTRIEWEEGDIPGVNRYFVTFPANPAEHIYGCGETYSKLDLKGERVRIWVAEHQNTRRISGKIIKWKIRGKRPDKVLPFKKYESYYAQPTFVSSDHYFMHCDTNAYSEIDFSDPSHTTFELQEKPVIYISEGENFPELSEHLSALLGKQGALPDWIYDGAILGIQEGTDVVDQKIQSALDAGVPVTGVWCQDWSGCRRTGFGYQVMWNWEWDRELYPNLDQKIHEWKMQGVHFLGYINPFLAIEKDIYKEATAKGYCVKNAAGEDYLVTITTFPAAMIDFTNPDAYDWYKNLIKENMIGLGMSGWMADFGEYLPLDAVLYSGEDPAVIHNQWPAIWAKMNREAIKECGKEDEVFFFTRAGHTGTIQNSTMMWTGDQHVDWSVDDGLLAVIPATLSLAMSGFCITHSDIGGYTTIMQMTRSKELLMRWEEMNVFSPLYRSHEGNQPARNVQFDADEELLSHLAQMAKIHVRLKPYLKELVAETEAHGTPVMRPLFYHYEESMAYTEKTEYLLGRDMLVCPVYQEGAASRSCYLPEDTWVHLFTGQEYTGGVHEIDAPIGQPPVFVRKSSERFTELRGIIK